MLIVSSKVVLEISQRKWVWQTELRKSDFNYSETKFLEFLAGTFFFCIEVLLIKVRSFLVKFWDAK